MGVMSMVINVAPVAGPLVGSVGVTLLGLLQAVLNHWVAWLFLVVATAQVVVFVLGSRLGTASEGQTFESGQLEHFSSP
jgi:MFS family permease